MKRPMNAAALRQLAQREGVTAHQCRGVVGAPDHCWVCGKEFEPMTTLDDKEWLDDFHKYLDAKWGETWREDIKVPQKHVIYTALRTAYKDGVKLGIELGKYQR